MYVIGTVARLAGVTVRTLRHYDETGLLRPAWVDPTSGYRWFRPDQLHRLHRILALRDLGLSLSEIQRVLDGDRTADLQSMLTAKRAELDERVSDDVRRLARVDARLMQIEEGAMTDYDVIVKALAGQRVVYAQERVATPGHIGHAEVRLFDKIHAAMARQGVAVAGPTFATCQFTDADPPIVVGAAAPVHGSSAVHGDGLDTVDLPAVPRAATTVVTGAPNFEEGFSTLARWARDAGERTTGPSRSVYIDCAGPETDWVVELQVPLA